MVSSWNRISYTSDSLSDSSLRQGAEGAGNDWVDGKTVNGSEGGVEVFIEYLGSLTWVMYYHSVINEVWFKLRL